MQDDLENHFKTSAHLCCCNNLWLLIVGWVAPSRSTLWERSADKCTDSPYSMHMHAHCQLYMWEESLHRRIQYVIISVIRNITQLWCMIRSDSSWHAAGLSLRGMQLVLKECQRVYLCNCFEPCTDMWLHQVQKRCSAKGLMSPNIQIISIT